MLQFSLDLLALLIPTKPK